MEEKPKYSKSTIKKAVMLSLASAINYAPEAWFVSPDLTESEMKYADDLRHSVICKIMGEYEGAYAGNLTDALKIINKINQHGQPKRS